MAFAAGEPEDASDWLTQAVDTEPNLAESWLLLAQIQLSRNLIPKALSAIKEAVCLRPKDSRMWEHWGHINMRQGFLVSAYTHFSRAAELDPLNFNAMVNARKAAATLGRTNEALQWSQRLVEAEPRSEARHSEHLALLCADPSATEESLFAASRKWAHCLPQASPPDKSQPKRIRPRLGFISSTFHNHVVSRFFLPLLESLPREHFETVQLFHDGTMQDDVTARLQSLADTWIDLTKVSDNEAIKKIQSAELDILIDINGHFDRARLRLLSRFLAPIMVHYLGGACTTGLETMGYRFADEISEPPGASDRWSTEKILRLPRGFHCYDPASSLAEPTPLPAQFDPILTFGTTTALHKLNPDLLRVWGKLLVQVPNSRLVLVKEFFSHAENRDDLVHRFGELGIPPDRLELRTAPREAFLLGKVWNAIDIALDPFPYNGVTTTCEALCMGVPVVALRGSRLIARTAASLLSHVGRPEWVADNHEHYIEIAASLAHNREKLASIRAGLRKEFLTSPLGQPRIIASDFADALMAIWAKDTN